MVCSFFFAKYMRRNTRFCVMYVFVYPEHHIFSLAHDSLAQLVENFRDFFVKRFHGFRQELHIKYISQSNLKRFGNTLVICRVDYYNSVLCRLSRKNYDRLRRGEEQGGKSPFSPLSEPISPSSLLF